MIRHEDIERLIQKVLEREATAEEKKVLSLHLSECANCKMLYQELMQTEQALFGLVELYPRADFNDRVLRKIGFRKSPVWARAAVVFGAAWLGSMMFLVFSPFTREIFNRVLTSTPALIRFFDKVRLIVTTLGHTLTPLVKNSFNPTAPILGLILSIFIFFLLSKTLRKESKCTA
jgi:predicted anti-sigma-YlaC factor YlaD